MQEFIAMHSQSCLSGPVGGRGGEDEAEMWRRKHGAVSGLTLAGHL